jgi:hypothetical protein
MCTGLEIAALAASAAGTGVQISAQNSAAEDQARAARADSERALDVNRRAGARVSEEVERLKADDAVDEEQETQNAFLAALRKSQLTGGSMSDSESGNVSERFSNDSAAVKRQNVLGNRAAATQLARIDAPFLQRARQAAGASRTASDLSRIANESAGQDFLSQLRMSLMKPNAGKMAAGELLTGVGSGLAQRARPVKAGQPYTGVPRTVDSTIPGGY